MKRILAHLVFSLVATFTSYGYGFVPENALTLTESSDIAFVGKLDKPQIITLMANGKVLQIGGKEIIQKQEYPMRGVVLYSMDVTPDEVIYDPEGYFKKSKSITMFWSENVHIQKGSNSAISSFCPPIQTETLRGEKSIILLDKSELGYTMNHSINLEHLARIKNDRKLRDKEFKRIEKIMARQNWDLEGIDIGDPFEDVQEEKIVKKNEQEQVEAYKSLADTMATSFLFAATYPLRSYGALILNDRYLHASKPYFDLLKDLRDRYGKIPNHRKEVLKLMNEILSINGKEMMYKKNPASWSNHPTKALEFGYMIRFIKLAKLLDAPEHLFFPISKEGEVQLLKSRGKILVKRLGRKSIEHPYVIGENSLLEIIKQTGGFTTFDLKQRVRLFRSGKVYSYNLDNHEHQQLLISPGDIISIGQSTYFGDKYDE